MMIHCQDDGAGAAGDLLQQPAAVRAASDLPAGLLLGVCPAYVVTHLASICSDELPTPHTVLQVRYHQGSVRCEGGALAASDWLKAVQPARDRHEQNVEVCGDGSSALLSLQTLRHIRQGEQLLLWFSVSLASQHNIPVLSPANIRGGQQYTCTECSASYRHPNVLKSHLRYHCKARVGDMRPPSMLLRTATQSYLSLASSPYSRQGRENLSPPAAAAASSPRLTPHTPLSQTSGDGSAFRPPHKTRSGSPEAAHHPSPATRAASISPIKHRPAMSSTERLDPLDLSTSHPRLTPSLSFSLPPDHPAFKLYYPLYGHLAHAFYPPLPPQQNYLHTNYISPYMLPHRMHKLSPHTDRRSPTDRGSQGSPERGESSGVPVTYFPLPSDKEGEPLDLLPRSLYMSKSRKGHLCIYCGKLYSRKYGLKIHLRTHTGYKPLKCKVCLRPFGDPSNLNKHIRLHSEGDTPYRCEHCGKVLVRRRDLERHIKSRHPDAQPALDDSLPPENDDDTDDLDEEIEVVS